VAEGTKKPPAPLILGIVTARMLAGRRYPESVWKCDGVELRADGLPPDGVLPAVEAFAAEKIRRDFRGPVVFTLRLGRDGGAWDDAKAGEREFLWRDMAAQTRPLCDILDIELEAAALIDSKAWRASGGKRLKRLLSHHAFVPEEPSVWEKYLDSMKAFNPEGVKFAVAVRSLEETVSLLRFAREVAKQFPLSCVIGMGDAGRTTRVLSPLLGCPVTYAFLEEGPVAPGQLSVGVLRACFARTDGRPELDSSGEEWIRWAERTLREFSHAG
jgi:3-dehydroquinate dehydratase type I